MAASKTVRIEYSLDSLGDISAEAFESACLRRAEKKGFNVIFSVGLTNRETVDGEPSDEIVERAWAECCQ